MRMNIDHEKDSIRTCLPSFCERGYRFEKDTRIQRRREFEKHNRGGFGPILEKKLRVLYDNLTRYLRNVFLEVNIPLLCESGQKYRVLGLLRLSSFIIAVYVLLVYWVFKGRSSFRQVLTKNTSLYEDQFNYSFN